MIIKSFSETKPKGGDKYANTNEDALYIDKGRRFFIVADGLGELGHERSEEAVGRLTEQIDYTIENDYSSKAMEGLIREFVKKIHECYGGKNLKFLRENPNDVKYFVGRHPREIGGTTLEALVHLESERQFLLVHTGDSKTIGITAQGAYEELSIEQSPWRRHATEQSLSEEEQLTDHDRNIMDSFLGMGKAKQDPAGVSFVPGDIQIDTKVFPADKYNYLLMATDGVFDYATQREIAQIITSEPLETAAQRLIERAHNPQDVFGFYLKKAKEEGCTEDDVRALLAARDDASAIVIKLGLPEIAEKQFDYKAQMDANQRALDMLRQKYANLPQLKNNN